ncbi:MAG TPA: cobalamin B12-binding domain-containing protein [Caldisericia bacterium]|jgi:methylmalonyl-CoA mutase C-terminal domain/subunit|nr:cobalamin B12-binding domain-containing protein [Caldisericia bacterium]HXK51978.1 cobalamin B12-binding domain-containing protein [Caldisericia bacterium]
MNKPIRVLIAKPGLDGHDRGAKIIARALKDAGMEVIYTGIKQTPESIARTALQEDIDVLGLSILSGAHNHLFPEIMKHLHQHKLDHILVIAGGIIPKDDIPFLQEIGIKAIYPPGSSLEDIVSFIRTNVPQSTND